MASRYWVGGSANWDGTAGSKWSTTSGGGGGAAVPTTSDAVFFDTNSGANTVTLATVTANALSIDCTGFTGTLAGSVTLVCGNVTLGSGMTLTYTGTFNPSTCLFTSNGKTFTGSINTSNFFTLQDNFVMTGRFTLTSRTFSLNGFSATIGGFTSASNTNTRALTIGAGGTLTLTNTWVTSGTQTNFTHDLSGKTIYFTGSNAITIATVTSAAMGANIDFQGSSSLTFTAGTGTWGNVLIKSGTGFSTSVNVQLNTLDFTGFTGTWSGTTAFKIAGDLKLSSGMTITNSGTVTNNLASTQNYTSNGKTLTCNLTTSNGAINLIDALTLGSTQLLTINNSITTNGFTVTTGLFKCPTGTLNMGSGLWVITGTTGVVATFELGNSSAALTATNCTIKFTNTSNSTVSMNFGSITGYSFGVIQFDRGASTGINAITQQTGANSYSIAELKDTGTAAHSIYFGQGSIYNIALFTVTGTSGNVVTINSCDSTYAANTSTHSLVKSGAVVSCDYMNIQHSVATPSSTWYAGANSTDNQAVANAGSGWLFTVPPVGGTSNFFEFF
jgi:hypothetical protein